MSDIKNITQKLIDFRNDRDWKQFHNPKDLALALSIEASELNELFLWKKHEDADIEKIKEELADVFAYALMMADGYGFDVSQIIEEKMIKNGIKYPIEKAKGKMTKYTDLK